MVKSYSRGHEIYFLDSKWKYTDNNKPLKEIRSCKKCGKIPTKEGFDACLGYIEGATSACCGHGITEKIIIY